MIFDATIADADLLGDLRIGHAFQPVHQEDAAGLAGHGQQCPPIDPPDVSFLDSPGLLGRRRCIPTLVDRTGDDVCRRPATRTADEKVARASGEIGWRIFDMFDNARSEQLHENLMREVGGIVPSHALSEEMWIGVQKGPR